MNNNRIHREPCSSSCVANENDTYFRMDALAILRELGWQPFFENQTSPHESTSLIAARVSAHHGGHLELLTESGELSLPASLVAVTEEGYPDASAGSSWIAVGDWLLLEPETHRVVRRLDRKTLLSRKAAGETVKPQLIAANVDTVFIVCSCNLDFNLSRLERYLAVVLESEAFPVIVLTKADLSDDSANLRRQAERLHPGLVVETLDAREPQQVEVLKDWCGIGKTVSLLGSSGVGKSTLTNALGGFDLKTSSIREDDDKGRHTTTARSMHRLAGGGWLIDNPGVRELQLTACESGLADLFDDVLQIASECRFRNCSHQGDAGCAVEAAIESGQLDARRLTSYLKLEAEQARNSTSLAERREKDRKTGQMYKNVIAEKKRRRQGP